MSESAGKKLQIIPSILFIDGKADFDNSVDLCLSLEGAIVHQDKLNRSETIVAVTSVALKTKFPTFFTTIDQVFNSSPEIYEFVRLDFEGGGMCYLVLLLTAVTKCFKRKTLRP